ncbi:MULTISPECIES: YdcF family protein [unclassified Aureimonas]|uniref:YdcF family protein n=1 Tax=unclassified Aureimonas TaxID=2615206 RepID=UPI0006FC7C9E|nr:MULTISPECIES: YdcF family protein [unclassified Aureimonas]KQT60296.1 hypothetical protein ASG62_06410 [Aureimonas sp. Leaf427]KQT79172.1 hypothetical protein ASG54_09005 [Aureimonas sp. Leaf460]
MFFVLSKIGWFLLQPLALVFVLAVTGLVAMLLRWRRLGAGLLAFSLAIFGIAAFSPAGLLMTAVLEDRFPVPPLPDNIAGIVVLGGALDTRVARFRGGYELNEAADRMTAGVALSRRYPNAKLVFTGGVAAVFEDDASESQSAAAFFADMGVPAERVMFEGRARNTVENAVFTKALVEPKPGEVWLLVTSAYHMPRSVGCFRRAGFEVLPYPVDHRTPSGPANWRPSSDTTRNVEKVHYAIREYLGLAAYWASGKTDALLPGPR